MTPVDTAGGSHSPRVPAWKRLGLKLKYANDTAAPSTAPHQSDTLDSKADRRRQTEPGHDLERPSKKRKVSTQSHHRAPSIPQKLSTAAGSAQEDQCSPDEQPAIAAPSTSARQSTEIDGARETKSLASSEPRRPDRRKSVTFTEGTKAEDGHSAQSLGDPTTDPVPSTAPISPADRSSIGDAQFKQKEPSQSTLSDPKDNSSVKSSKKKTDPQKDPDHTEPPEYRRYLETYHNDKASWKFNKNHQTSLLKHLFDIAAVPPSLNPAVGEYLAGLKGTGPRERLSEHATTILRTIADKVGSLEDIDQMNTATARREAYFRALHRELRKWEEAGMPHSEYDDNTIEQLNAELERGKRAEEVLRALCRNDSQVEPTATTGAVSTEPKSSARKRKQRVAAELSSSSSNTDTSSDSDSESGSDTPPTSHAPTPRAETVKTVSDAFRPLPPAPPPYKAKAPPTRPAVYQHDNFNMAYRPQNPSQLMAAAAKPTKKFFDDDLLDEAFGPKKTSNGVVAKKRKAEKEEVGRRERKQGRSFAYTHGTRGDDSGSESG